MLVRNRRDFLNLFSSGLFVLSLPAYAIDEAAAGNEGSKSAGGQDSARTYACVVSLDGKRVARLLLHVLDEPSVIAVDDKTRIAVRLLPSGSDRWLRLQLFDVDSSGRAGAEIAAMNIGDHTVARFSDLGLSFNVFSVPKPSIP